MFSDSSSSAKKRRRLMLTELEARETPAFAAFGPEVAVAGHPANVRSNAVVASDSSGNYVVAWQSLNEDASNSFGVYAQRFNAAGDALTSRFIVNTTTASDQISPAVAMDAAGDFVIAWVSPDVSGNGVYAQRYAADATPRGGQFLVPTTTAGNQFAPTVAMDAVGDFVIAWASAGQDGSGDGVYARQFTAAGTPRAAEFPVNIYTTSNQNDPSVAMDAAGDFTVAWVSDGQDGSGNGVFARQFTAAGVGVPGEIPVNIDFTTFAQDRPTVVMDAAGDFVVTWVSSYQDGDSGGIFARRFTAAGGGFSQFLVNTAVSSTQNNATAAIDAPGNFVIGWETLGPTGAGTASPPNAMRPTGRRWEPNSSSMPRRPATNPSRRSRWTPSAA